MHPINAEKIGHVVSGSPIRRPVRKKEGRSGNRRKKGRNEKGQIRKKRKEYGKSRRKAARRIKEKRKRKRKKADYNETGRGGQAPARSRIIVGPVPFVSWRYSTFL